MGGSSSKTKKSKFGGSKYELSHTVDGDGPSNTTDGVVTVNIRNKERQNSSKKKKNRNSKGSVKIKAEKKSRSKSFRTNDAKANLDPILVADISESGSQQKFPLPNSPVYRKKSSCPSCEAKEILLGKNRSRSSSEMRFSDFNKVLRKTRIYDWEMVPVDIPLYDAPEPQPEDVCYICGVYTGSHVRVCRVCYRAYHDGCLAKIGHTLNEKARHLISSKLWSCHQCSALNHLLTQEEVRAVLDDFQDLGISKDNIREEDYLKYCQHSLQQQDRQFTDQKKESSMARFRSIAHPQTGITTWANFLNIESIRILNGRCKDSLVHLLTQAEIAEARKIFQQLDKEKMGVTTKAAVQALLDSDKARYSAYYPDDSMMYIDDDLNGSLTWGDFLRDRAIYFLGRRPCLDINDVSRSGSLDNDIGGVAFTASSVESMDDDDEEYNTCHSDLETSTSPSRRPNTDNSKDHGHNTKASLDDSTEGQMSPLHTSTDMLEEFTSEMDKCCMRHSGANSTDKNNEKPGTNVDHDCGGHRVSKSVGQSASVPKDQSITSADVSSKTSTNAAPKISKSTPECKDEKISAGNAKSTPEKTRTPHNNNSNSRQVSIPWDDLGDRSVQRSEGNRRDGSKIGQRKSEVIPRRQEKLTTDQARAVSQVGCRQGRNVLAPAYGNLVGRVNTGEWGC